MSRQLGDCPKCGSLLSQYGCGVCGYGRDQELSPQALEDIDRVSVGNTVYITYHDLRQVPAIVRSIQDRAQGILSIRILPKDMPTPHAYGTDPTDGMIPLVVVAGEWELAKS